MLQLYERASHQLINFQKSKVFFIHTPERIQARIANMLNCSIGKLPSVYIGMPLFIGCSRKEYWDRIIQRIDTKLAGWKATMLSNAGKLLLVKTILQSMAIYCALIFKVPVAISEKIDQICNRFLWTRNSETRKFTLVAWKTVCKSKRLGGLGLRRVKQLSKALRGKLAWRMVNGEKA